MSSSANSGDVDAELRLRLASLHLLEALSRLWSDLPTQEAAKMAELCRVTHEAAVAMLGNVRPGAQHRDEEADGVLNELLQMTFDDGNGRQRGNGRKRRRRR